MVLIAPPAFRPAILCLAASLMVSACSPKPPEAVPVEKASAQAKSAFSAANGEVKAAAAEVTSSLDRSDYAGALKNIENLSFRPDLEREQREALAAAQIAAMIKLQEAAAQGDKDAADFLEKQRARK